MNTPSARTPLVLDIDQANNLTLALKRACDALQIERHDIASRAVIAGRIADLVRAGMRDPDTICKRVLHEAEALSSLEAEPPTLH